MKIIKSTIVPISTSEVGMYLVNVPEDINLNGIYIVTEFVPTVKQIVKISNDNDKYTKAQVDGELLIIDTELEVINGLITNILADLTLKNSIISNKASLQSLNKEILDRIYSVKLLRDSLSLDIEYLQSQIDEINVDKYLDPQYVYDGKSLVLKGKEKLTVKECVFYEDSDYIRDIDNNTILDSKNNKITINK